MPITEAEFTDIASLIRVARQTLQGFGQTLYWFRGHAQANWTLVPSVHRHYDSVDEQNLMIRFRLGAPTRYSNCPGVKDVAGWITLMQHFGLPTRLLDWTGSLIVAAYFAVSHEPRPGSGPAAIWVLLPNELNKASSHASDSIFLLENSEAKPLLAAATNGPPCADEVLSVMAVDLDLRVTVQMGAFTLHGGPKPLEQRDGADKYLAKFTVPSSARANVAKELWALGVRRSSLFPDLSNLAADLASDWRLIPRRPS